MTPVVGSGICYAVICADDNSAGLTPRTCRTGPNREGPSAMAHVALRLAIDVVADVGGYPRCPFVAPSAGVLDVAAAVWASGKRRLPEVLTNRALHRPEVLL